MRLAVRDFKSVSQLDRFEFAPLTMLAGVNSSGKTSLLQAVLLLKQTLIGDNKKPLQLMGDYLNAESLTDIIYKKAAKGSIAFSIELSADEIANVEDYNKYSPMDDETMTGLGLEVSFNTNGDLHIKELGCTLFYGNAGIERFKVSRRNNLYDVSFSSQGLFGGNIGLSAIRRRLEGCKVEFTNFIPLYIETSQSDGNRTYSVAVMKDVLTSVKSFFNKIEYLGPSRVEPVLARSYDRLSYDNVGIHGENTRFLLNQYKNLQVEGYNQSLTQVVTHWICDEMGMARSFDVVRDSNMRYRTVVVNNGGFKVDLTHMGYGLSQVLPVIVQGLLTPVDGAFIVVDPEVHMHPKVQAILVDFFIDLMRHGRKVVVETHSDHIVTRLRRRIADGTVKKEEVNLSFVENGEKGSAYRFIDLESDGSFVNDLPKGFLDSQENDFMEIIALRAK